MKRTYLDALSPQLLKRSIKTAIVVGIILNLINQWQAVFGDSTIAWTSLILTFIVPFLVSIYSGVMTASNHKQ
jgi:methyl-accepting chemotaxis protein